MQFRPLPVLTLLALIIFAVLIRLGVWQLHRAEWKADEIDAYKARAAVEAMDLETAACAPEVSPEGRPVALTPGFSPLFIRVYGFSIDGQAGWHRYGLVDPPSCLAGEGKLLVETGFEGFQSGEIETIARLRIDPLSAKKGLFTSPNQPEKNEWYWIEPDAVDAYLFPSGADKINRDWIILADSGLPTHLTKTPPERHVGYSVTWFGLAIALLVMYVAFHVHAGRLRFGGED